MVENAMSRSRRVQHLAQRLQRLVDLGRADLEELEVVGLGLIDRERAVRHFRCKLDLPGPELGDLKGALLQLRRLGVQLALGVLHAGVGAGHPLGWIEGAQALELLEFKVLAGRLAELLWDVLVGKEPPKVCLTLMALE